MAASVSLATITSRAQSLADMINDNFVSTTEWTFWINSAAQDLYDKLTQADPERYMNVYQFTSQPNTQSYALPSDFYKLLRVDAVYGTANLPLFYTLRKFSLLEEDSYQFPIYNIAGPVYRYRLRGNNLWITPGPLQATTMNLWYTPVFTQLVNQTDTFDGINGWEQYVVLQTAVHALQKEGATDPSFLVAEMEKWEQKIKALELERDSSFPEQTIDVMRGPWPWRGMGGNGSGP